MSGGITSAVGRYLIGKEEMDLSRDIQDRGTFRDRMLARQQEREWQSEQLLRQAQDIEAEYTIQNFATDQRLKNEIQRAELDQKKAALAQMEYENKEREKIIEQENAIREQIPEIKAKLLDVETDDDLDVLVSEYGDVIMTDKELKGLVDLKREKAQRTKASAKDAEQEAIRQEIMRVRRGEKSIDEVDANIRDEVFEETRKDEREGSVSPRDRVRIAEAQRILGDMGATPEDKAWANDIINRLVRDEQKAPEKTSSLEAGSPKSKVDELLNMSKRFINR